MLQNEYHYPEPARVQLAILKIVNGNIAALPSEIERAKFDFRDVLVIAEYPTDWKERGFQTNVPTDKQRQIYEEDWKQYNTWLNK